jgi:hypothetical protein
MFKFLQRFRKKEQIQEPEEPKPISAMYFLLYEDGSIQFVPEWLNDNPELAKLYALLLYQIVSPLFIKTVFHQLHVYAKNDESGTMKTFVKRIIKQYRMIESKVEEMPIIRPEEVFNIPKKVVDDETT